MTRLIIALIGGSTMLGACSRSSGEARKSGQIDSTMATTTVAQTPVTGTGVATAGPIVPVSGASASGGGGDCPRTGLWAECSVEKRLSQSGFVVRRETGGANPRAGFSVTPTIYTLGRSRLEVFIYPTQAAANADVRRIDTASAAPKGVPSPWPMPPTFVRSANLVAVFLTDNPTQAERLTLALTAGAPQP